MAYEVVEVSDSECYIDHWVAVDQPAPAFGRLPLADGELLPPGALDDEPLDEQRLLEASGNEGVSFERAYRRAALILWPPEAQIDVLLQAGVGAALPALEAMLAEQGSSPGALDATERIVAPGRDPGDAMAASSANVCDSDVRMSALRQQPVPAMAGVRRARRTPAGASATLVPLTSVRPCDANVLARLSAREAELRHCPSALACAARRAPGPNLSLDRTGA